jgi:hypothetical protein
MIFSDRSYVHASLGAAELFTDSESVAPQPSLPAWLLDGLSSVVFK